MFLHCLFMADHFDFLEIMMVIISTFYVWIEEDRVSLLGEVY